MNEKSYQFLRQIGNWVITLFILNLSWIVFTVLGLGIFGFAPATYSVYEILMDKEKKTTNQLFSRFFRIYKRKFFDANLIGIAYVLIIFIIGYNLMIYSELSEYMSLAIWLYLFMFIFILLIHSFLIIFPLEMRFDYKNNFELVRATFTIPFVFPIKTVFYLISISAILLVYFYIPILILIFGIIPIAFFTNGHIEYVKNKMIKIKEKKMK
ncbi:DUF624 domain-containing protein [Mycoplasmatota bacterium WC44]